VIFSDPIFLFWLRHDDCKEKQTVRPNRGANAVKLTIVIKEENVKIDPVIPVKPAIWLTEEFAGMDQLAVLIKQVQILIVL
jgi:hypothetical protein